MARIVDISDVDDELFQIEDDFGDVRAVVPREIVVVVAARDDTAGDAVRTTVLRVVPVRAAVVVVRVFIF